MTGQTAQRADFETWQARAPFLAAANTAIDEVGNAFWAPQHQWRRDLWLACAFAERVVARRVRLIPHVPRPDFQVELRNGHVMSIEATEADMPGRRRHQEYKAEEAAGFPVRIDPGEDWEKRRRAIPGAVRTAAIRKASMNYPAGTSLLIYVNLGTYGKWRREVENELVTCTAPAHGKFRSVWALWGGRLYRCWPNPSAYHTEGRLCGLRIDDREVCADRTGCDSG